MSSGKALLAAFIATLVLSILMMMTRALGITPGLHLPAMIAAMSGVPDSPGLGWFLHFLVGTVAYGLTMKALVHASPGRSPVKLGMGLAVAGWLILMLVLMPMAGAGLFGMTMGPAVPIVTLLLHLIFGAVLGWLHARLLGADGQRLPAH